MIETCPEGHEYEVTFARLGYKAHPMDQAEPNEYTPDHCPVCAAEEEAA